MILLKYIEKQHKIYYEQQENQNVDDLKVRK